MGRGPAPWASATGDQDKASACSPAPPPNPLARLPSAAALTQSTRPADWLEGKNYNVGVGMGGEARSRAVSQG